MRRPAVAALFGALLSVACLRTPGMPVAGAVRVAASESNGGAGGVTQEPVGRSSGPAAGSVTSAVTSASPTASTTASAARRDTLKAGSGRPAAPAVAAPRPAGDSVSSADVTRESARVFGADSAPAPGSASGEPLWDIDVRSYETRKRVEEYVRIFSGPRVKSVFEVALQRQTRYGPMIRDRLRQKGLPEDLTYLALVESWFNPHAYSRAAAVGFWQFMASTGRGMGLRVDWWMDERRDPVRSTEAAARLLLGLRGQFGSLYLAAAAYNGGSGRVSRGLARYADALDGVEGEDRFFALAEKSYLRKETRDYVPKIIAAALVGEEPARYGVRVDSLPPYGYDSVRAPGGTPLAAIANALGLENAELSELNPHLLRGMTPPADSLWVRVPTGRADGFDERFSALEPEERQALTRMESRKGQTMVSIAKAHGITSKQLAWYNPKVVKLKSGALRAGQLIQVPRKDVVALARDVPNPSVERYPRRASTSVRRHKVASGQSLSTIAKKYGVSVPTLMKLNGLKSETLRPGQSLVVSGRTATTARPKAAAAKSSTAKAGAKSSAKSPAKSAPKSSVKSSSKSSSKTSAKAPAKSSSKGSAKAASKSPSNTSGQAKPAAK